MPYKKRLKIIGTNIKKLRNDKGYAGEGLARLLGITRAALSQWESGQKDFKISDLQKVADLLDTEVCSLVSPITIYTESELTKMNAPEKFIVVEKDVIQHLVEEVQTLSKVLRK